MKNRLLVIALALLAVAPLPSQAELVNDFACELNKGYAVPQLYAFQKEWMAAAKKQGFSDAAYKTRIYFPLYSDKITTDPLSFVWRGSFSDGTTIGRMIDWFPSSEWAGRFAQMMNCQTSSLWTAPQ